MKLSFVIPAYNEEAYLPICLEAVCAEKKKGKYDMEIIVVNNASTDNTRKVALSYPGVICVDEPKKGLSAARQAGFLSATGDLIANIDSDSVLTPGWVDTVMDSFSKNPRLIALSGPFIFHDFSIGHNLLVRIQYLIDYYFYFVNRFIFRISSLLQGGNFVIRKTALDQIGGFNPEFPFWGEDTNIAKRLNPLGPVVFTFKLPIYSSGRRLKKGGTVRTTIRYSLNYFSTIFFNKPFSVSYNDIRQSEINQDRFRTDLAGFNTALVYAKLISAILIFNLFGGVAFVWDRMLENIQPITASASVMSIDDHLVLDKVHSSVVKVKEKIKNLGEKFSKDE